MTDRHDPDRHDPAASLPSDRDLPTAGHKPPHQSTQPAASVTHTPDDEPTVINPPPRTPGETGADTPETRPGGGPSSDDPGGRTEARPGGRSSGDPGAETKPIPVPGAARGVGEEVTTRLVASGSDEGPTVEQERADPNGPTRRLSSGRDEWPEPAGGQSSAQRRPEPVRESGSVDPPGYQEPEPGPSAERVNHPGGVDIPGAVGNGDGLVQNDVLAETAEPAADAAAGRPRETPGESAADRSGEAGGEESGAETSGEAGVNGEGPKRWRLSSAGALICVLLALFGFTLVVQLRSNTDDQGLASARQEDLVAILSDLEARDSRLQTEITGLEASQRQLTSGVSSRQAALAEAAKRADELGLLAGTLPGKGPGLKIVIDKVKASAILNAVEELRGAGGEVMELAGANGVTVRIVASSYFVDAEGGGIVADGARVTGPYTLWVIGSPQTMQTALQIPGGVVASVNSAGGSVTMEAQTLVQVAAVRKATTLQYAHPVS